MPLQPATTLKGILNPTLIERDPKYDVRSGYRQRMLFSFAVALLFINVVLLVWPAQSEQETRLANVQAAKREIIQIAEVLPTRHGATPLGSEEGPPPAAPLPPVVVPDEIVLEEQELDLAPAFAMAPGPEGQSGGSPAGAPGSSGTGDGVGTAETILIPPKPLRLVEPEYSREARRKRIKAEIRIEVLVDEHGNVRQTKVLERFLLTSSGRERVAVLGYGLEEAAVSAAERWRFRPARKGGRPIEHPYTLSITLGS